MSNISTIIAKIKALRARAADAASSENEAAKAAAVADKLLREHNLTLDDVEVRAAGVVKHVWNPGTRTRGPITRAAGKIGKATGVDIWIENGGEVVLLGSPADVEVACYYLDLVDNAMDACTRTWRGTTDYHDLTRYLSPRAAGRDYRIGVASRLGERILDSVQQAEAAAPTGTSLVVVKDALIRQWKEERNMAFKKARKRMVNTHAYNNGRDAAEGVGIGRGVGVQRTGQQLLG